MDQNESRPMVHSAVDAAMMLAAMRHFSLCDKARDATWSEPKVFIEGNPYHFDFVKAALDHAVSCTDAQPLNIRTNPFANSQEPVMTETADQPEPQPIPVPALNLNSDRLEGVVLTTDHAGVVHQYDLAKVAKWVPRMQFRRYDTARLTTVIPTESSDWDLTPGLELTLYAITGNGQYMIIGNDAYAYSDVKGLLDTHGNQLEIGATEYTPPAWATQSSQQEQHVAGLPETELQAESGQLLHDRTPQSAYGTGLAPLPASDASATDDELYEPDDSEPQELSEHFINTTRDPFWVPRGHVWVLTILGFSVGALTAATLTIGTHHHFNLFWSVLIGLIGGVSITCGAGIIGSLATDNIAIDPRFVTNEYEGQQILWTCGAIVGWMILTLVDLAFLL